MYVGNDNIRVIIYGKRLFKRLKHDWMIILKLILNNIVRCC
jgi:hypothetical protein